MPALYILEHRPTSSSFLQIFLVPLLGAVLGVLFLIPFRRYFVREMHGKLPFPEGTATTEVLVAGEKRRRAGARPRLRAGGRLRLRLPVLTFEGLARHLHDGDRRRPCDFSRAKVKAVFSMNTTAAICGLGYIIGVRYAAIIMAGSLLLLVRRSSRCSRYVGAGSRAPDRRGHETVGAARRPTGSSPTTVRYIGIGGIFAAGVIGIIKMSPVIGQAFAQGVAPAPRSRPGEDAPAAHRAATCPCRWSSGSSPRGRLHAWVYFRFSVLAGPAERRRCSPRLAVLVTVLIASSSRRCRAWAVAMISDHAHLRHDAHDAHRRGAHAAGSSASRGRRGCWPCSSSAASCARRCR